MSPENPAEKEIEYLIELYLDKNLTGQEADILLRHVENRPELAKRLYDVTALDNLIRDYYGKSSGKSRLIQSGTEETGTAPPSDKVDWEKLVYLETLSPGTKTEGVTIPGSGRSKKPDTTPSKKPIVGRKNSPESAWPLLCCFALFLLFFSTAIYFEFFGESSDPAFQVVEKEPFVPLGTVRAAVDIQWPQDEMQVSAILKSGNAVEMERIVFKKGLMELVLESGVRIAMEGEVDVDLSSNEKLFCEKGHLSVFVPPGAEGFTVETPFLNIVDKGTAFTVEVGENGAETHVVTGEVELVRPLHGSTSLFKGNAIRLGPFGEFRRMKSEKNRYLDEETVQKKLQLAREQEIKFEESARSKFAQDPALIIDLDFNTKDQRKIPNRAKHAEYRIDQVKFVSGTRVPGFLSNSQAVALRNRVDAIEFEIPFEMQSFTLFALVYFEELDRLPRVLLASRSFNQGSLFWQLNQSGSIELAFQYQNKEAARPFESASCFKAKHRGTWYRIASVFDAKTNSVRHYVDGKQIANIPLKQKPQIRPGAVTLGNGLFDNQRQPRKKSNHSLGGYLDRFMLLNRALNDAEIAELSDH